MYRVATGAESGLTWYTMTVIFGTIGAIIACSLVLDRRVRRAILDATAAPGVGTAR